jgi:hypothetical protein
MQHAQPAQGCSPQARTAGCVHAVKRLNAAAAADAVVPLATNACNNNAALARMYIRHLARELLTYSLGQCYRLPDQGTQKRVTYSSRVLCCPACLLLPPTHWTLKKQLILQQLPNAAVYISQCKLVKLKQQFQMVPMKVYKMLLITIQAHLFASHLQSQHLCYGICSTALPLRKHFPNLDILHLI